MAERPGDDSDSQTPPPDSGGTTAPDPKGGRAPRDNYDVMIKTIDKSIYTQIERKKE